MPGRVGGATGPRSHMASGHSENLSFPPTNQDPFPADSALLRAARSGDERAFADLYYRHRDWTYALAYRFTGDGHLAMDVVQETFLYILRKLPSLELRARFTTYLYPIVRSISASALRKRRETFIGDDADPSGAARTAEMHSDRPAIEQAVSKLPEAQREVVLLRFVHDMELAEIAVALDIPVGTVKSRLHHAVSTLRQNPGLSAAFDDERPRSQTGEIR